MSHTTPGTISYEVYRCECEVCLETDAPGGGVFSTVPTGPVRWHIQSLIDAGHSTGSIAVAAGVSQRTLNHIKAQRIRMTRRETADRILSVRLDEPPAVIPHAVPSAFIKPFIDELRRRGWTYARINAASGCSNTRKSANVAKHVHYLTWRRVVTLYELLARQGLVDASLLEVVRDG